MLHCSSQDNAYTAQAWPVRPKSRRARSGPLVLYFPMAKKITLNTLAAQMQKGFASVEAKIKKIDE